MLLAAFVLGYMEFGTMSINRYVPMYKLMRFTIIAAIPLSLVLGTALARIIDVDGRFRAARIAAVAAIVLFLLATSLPIDYSFYLYNHNSMEYVKLAASYLGGLRNTLAVHVYGPALEPHYLSYYLGYKQFAAIAMYDNGAYGGLFLPRCEDIPRGSYLVIPKPADIRVMNSYNLWSINETWALDPSICSLRLVADIYNSTAITGTGIRDPSLAGNVYYNG